ncbi:MAG: putative rane protein [Lacunisphaera sp.]|nr:putative rane protein [Lacunisphaera sp.]
MTSSQTVPALIIAFVSWRVYLRARRTIGRQHFRPAQLKVRIVMFSVVTLLLAAFALLNLPALGALAGGLVLAVGLSWFGLHLTKFEDTPEGKFYTPNTALGLAITALFVGRLLYRFFVIYSTPQLRAPGTPLAFQSPLTYFLFGLTAGYYIAYSVGVLIRSHRPAAALS